VNYPAHRAGHLKSIEGDCIPLTPAPHSSPPCGRGNSLENEIDLDEKALNDAVRSVIRDSDVYDKLCSIDKFLNEKKF
jgi:hypothetical protein